MGENIKQYVNLDPTHSNQLKEITPDIAGRTVNVVAKLNKPVPGIPIVFEIIAGKKNYCLHTKNFTRKHLAYIRSKLQGLVFAGRAKRRVPTNDKGEAHTQFIFSTFGGDEYEIKAYVAKRGGKKGKELVSNKYVTWRRIYYQVSRFSAGTTGNGQKGGLPEISHINWNSVEKEFESVDRRHHIELVRDGGKDIIPRYSNVLDLAINDKELKQSALDGYSSQRVPVTMRCVLVNMIAESADYVEQYSINLARNAFALNSTKVLWSDKSKNRGYDCVVAAKWKYDDGVDTQWKDFSQAFFECAGPYSAILHLEEIAQDAYNNAFGNKQVKIILAVKYRVLKSSLNGLSWYNAIWIANENMHSGKRPEDQKESTTIHEAGHFIGMTSPLQKTHYIKHGHQGPHCSTGLSPTDLALSSYRGLKGTCVMFGESAKSRKPKFCDVCDKSVREAEVKVAANMPSNPSSWDSSTT